MKKKKEPLIPLGETEPGNKKKEKLKEVLFPFQLN
jgi:hypothetical protein